jgi:predicted nucleotidyltransferase
VERLRREAEPLCREAGVEKIMLFGSYATGRQTASSDIDLLVVIDTNICDKDKAYRILRKGLSIKMIELHILSKEEYQSMKETRWIKTVEKEGKIIISRETKHA